LGRATVAVESRHMQWRDSVISHAKFRGVTKRATFWNFSLREVIYKILVLKGLKYKKILSVGWVAGALNFYSTHNELNRKYNIYIYILYILL